MENKLKWRWAVAANVRESIRSQPKSLWPRALPPLKKVFIGKDYDPASGEITVAGINIKDEAAVIARVPLHWLTNFRVMKTCNSWALVMMNDLERDGLWWKNTVADMNAAEAYRDMLRAEEKKQEST